MELTTEEILALTQGSIRHELCGDALRLSRFTAAQEAWNESRGEAKRMKNDATSGIRLEMDTTAEHLKLAYAIVPGSGRDWYGLDLSVDGVLVNSICEKTNRTENTWDVTLPPGKKRVTLYLSNLCGCRIRHLSLDGPFTPVRRGKKLLILGDSITQGYDARHPFLSYANLLTDALDAESLNQAIGGDTFCADALTDDLPWQPDLVTVAYGTNDLYMKADFLPDMEAYFDKLCRLYTCPILALTPIWRMGVDDECRTSPWGHTLEEVRTGIRQTAEKHGVTVLDGKPFVPHASDMYADGSLHPGDVGFAFYAQNLLKAIKKAGLVTDFS